MSSGLIRQPKWGHLKELHAAVKLSSSPLLSGAHTTFSLGEMQQVRNFWLFFLDQDPLQFFAQRARADVQAASLKWT